MKAAAFDLLRAGDLAQAGAALRAPGADARIMAGGQSLGPMLNLRLARPALVVSIAHLPDLGGVAEDAGGITLGAGVTHAAIADGRTPDFGDGLLARIAGGIAYRAIRNRGTIGGSLCHADPAADWLCTLTALDASVLTWRAAHGRSIRLRDFVTGAFRTVLEPGEIARAVHIPRPPAGFRWGYSKACRKPGEFAHAMAAVLAGPASNGRRAAIGATGSAPLLLEGAQATPQGLLEALGGPGADPVTLRLQAATLQRALDQMA